MNKSKRQLENWPAFNSSERESRSFFVVRTELNQYGYPIRPSNGQKPTALWAAGKVPLSVTQVQSYVYSVCLPQTDSLVPAIAMPARQQGVLPRWFLPRGSMDTCSNCCGRVQRFVSAAVIIYEWQEVVFPRGIVLTQTISQKRQKPKKTLSHSESLCLATVFEIARFVISMETG